jgi:hypothetical protein
MKTARKPIPDGIADRKYGPDPVLMKKIGKTDNSPRDLGQYKERIADRHYIDFAINRIAMELSHFLSR